MADFLARLSGLWLSPAQDRFASFLWCIYIAVLLAVLYAVYKNRFSGVLLEALQKNGCTDSNSGKTLAELGLGEKSTVRWGIRRDAGLRKIVACGDEKKDYLTGKLWIPAQQAEKAAYLARGGKVGIGTVLVAIFGFYALIVACYYVLPLFIGGIDTFFR